MTRSKPDQRRWSFCESVTAGVREYVKEGKRGRERGEEESSLCTSCVFKMYLFKINCDLFLILLSSVSENIKFNSTAHTEND